LIDSHFVGFKHFDIASKQSNFLERKEEESEKKMSVAAKKWTPPAGARQLFPPGAMAAVKKWPTVQVSTTVV